MRGGVPGARDLAVELAHVQVIEAATRELLAAVTRMAEELILQRDEVAALKDHLLAHQRRIN